MPDETITTVLDDERIARVDALAHLYGITRDEMLARIVVGGILMYERQARDAQARENGEGS
jgi:hypothetical protein